MLDNINQYFQSQAQISINFVSPGDPSAWATLSFVAGVDVPGFMSPLTPGETVTPINNGAVPTSYVNMQFLASLVNPNGSILQGAIAIAEHELTHALSMNVVQNGDVGLMAAFNPDTDLQPPSPSLQPEEIQQLQDSVCPQGDFGGNQGPVDPPPTDVPAFVKPVRRVLI